MGALWCQVPSLAGWMVHRQYNTLQRKAFGRPQLWHNLKFLLRNELRICLWSQGAIMSNLSFVTLGGCFNLDILCILICCDCAGAIVFCDSGAPKAALCYSRTCGVLIFLRWAVCRGKRHVLFAGRYVVVTLCVEASSLWDHNILLTRVSLNFTLTAIIT